MENRAQRSVRLPGRLLDGVRASGLLAVVLVACLSAGCVSYGRLSVLEPMARSPEREAIMNEAVDVALGQVDVGALSGKRVAVVLAPVSSAETAWPAHLVAELQKKLAAAGATCVAEQPEVQVVADVDKAALQKRILYVAFIPFFFADLYERQSYWAEFSCLLEFKDASGAQALESQAIAGMATPRKRCRWFTWGQLMY